MRRRELQYEVADESQLERALSWAGEMVKRGLPAGPVCLHITRPKRTLDQNAKLWPMLGDVSRQVEWYGQKLRPEEWKDVFTAGLKKQRAVPGIDGGFVILGAHTSTMTVRELSELVEIIYAFGAEHDVKWSEPKKQEKAA